jgi:hypothetical protein
MLSSGPQLWDVHADIRNFHNQAEQLHVSQETRELKVQAVKSTRKRGDAAKRISRERMEAAKAKLQAEHEARVAERKARRGKTVREVRREVKDREKRERMGELRGLVSEIMEDKTA